MKPMENLIKKRATLYGVPRTFKDAHVAGWYEKDKKPGWWALIIGPGKCLDTDKYFIICSNVLGGCKGSTGPSSINPETKIPLRIGFSNYNNKGYGKCSKNTGKFTRCNTTLCCYRGLNGGNASPSMVPIIS